MVNMKYSGIEWIGNIPNEWDIKKIKYIYSYQTGFTPDTSREDYYDNLGGYNWISIADMNNKYVSNSIEKISPKYINEKHPKVVKKGSLLYSFKLSVGKVAFARENLFTNEAIASFSIDKNCNLNYLYYASFLIENNANVNIYNAKILNKHLIGNSFTIYPSLKEQELIANFLDEKVSKIDNIINDLNKQIKILSKYKIQIISEIVSTGLNKNVQLKDSNTKWIGKIPEHWKIIRLKDCNKLQTGTTPKELLGITYEKKYNNFNWYTPGDYNNSNFLLSSSERLIDIQAIKDNRIKLYPENSILLVAIGATIGKLAYIQQKAYSNQQITTLIPNNIYYKYELYYLISISDYIKDNALYTTLPILNNQYLGEIKLIVPPINEQKKIAEYLDNKCSKIDKILERKNKQIEQMELYKKSIIYEYVTGKKRVKGAEELYG